MCLGRRRFTVWPRQKSNTTVETPLLFHRYLFINGSAQLLAVAGCSRRRCRPPSNQSLYRPNDKVQELHSLPYDNFDSLGIFVFFVVYYTLTPQREDCTWWTSYKPPRLFSRNISSQCSPIRRFVEVPCLSGRLACKQIKCSESIGIVIPSAAMR